MAQTVMLTHCRNANLSGSKALTMLVQILRTAGRRASQAAVSFRLAVPAARAFATDAAAAKPSGGGKSGFPVVSQGRLLGSCTLLEECQC